MEVNGFFPRVSSLIVACPSSLVGHDGQAVPLWAKRLASAHIPRKTGRLRDSRLFHN